MKDFDVSALLKKADELRALFVLGQRVIPFLEEIFVFFNEIKPLLDEINTNIQENLKKMPSASKQLSKVTEANELATTEIMDILDGLVYKTDIISSNIKRLGEINLSSQGNPTKIFEIIFKAMQSDGETNDMQNQLTGAIKNMKGSAQKEYDDVVNHTNEVLQSINDDSNSIMMSLQVQDITSQQIAAVNHLIGTIQEKLLKILQRFQNSDIGNLSGPEKHDERVNVSHMHRSIAFDPDAVKSFEQKETRQNDVDELLRQHKSGNVDIAATDNETISQDNIEELIKQQSSTPNLSEPAKVEEPTVAPVEVSEDDFSSVSQDDIDALFGK